MGNWGTRHAALIYPANKMALCLRVLIRMAQRALLNLKIIQIGQRVIMVMLFEVGAGRVRERLLTKAFSIFQAIEMRVIGIAEDFDEKNLCHTYRIA